MLSPATTPRGRPTSSRPSTSLACLRSFRAQRTEEMVASGARRRGSAPWWRPTACSGSWRCRLHDSPGASACSSTARACAPPSYVGGLNVVLFSPDDLQIPRGSPGARRKLLDRAIATSGRPTWPCRGTTSKMLQSRNRLLQERAGAAQRAAGGLRSAAGGARRQGGGGQVALSRPPSARASREVFAEISSARACQGTLDYVAADHQLRVGVRQPRRAHHGAAGAA